MTYQDRSSSNTGMGEAEATLRLIASLPAPEGLETRVQAGVRAAMAAEPHKARVLAWPVASSGWLRGAAAAAIVVVVAGGSWGVYAHVAPGLPQSVAGPRLAAPGGFSSAEAARRPHTLEAPVVPATATKPMTQPARAEAIKPKSPAPARASIHKPGEATAAPAR